MTTPRQFRCQVSQSSLAVGEVGKRSADWRAHMVEYPPNALGISFFETGNQVYKWVHTLKETTEVHKNRMKLVLTATGFPFANNNPLEETTINNPIFEKGHVTPVTLQTTSWHVGRSRPRAKRRNPMEPR